MIEQVLTRKNMLQAMRRVQKNHGSAGVDHMPVTKLSELMSIDKEILTEKVLSGKYVPQAILGVEIPKGNGKMRLLGIPTVTDRLLQRHAVRMASIRNKLNELDGWLRNRLRYCIWSRYFIGRRSWSGKGKT